MFGGLFQVFRIFALTAISQKNPSVKILVGINVDQCLPKRNGKHDVLVIQLNKGRYLKKVHSGY
jgi:hypothetical protein